MGERERSDRWVVFDAAPRPGGAPAAAPLRVAVYLDEVHVGAASRRQLLRRLADVLGERLRAEDEVMVASYDGGTRIRLPFSRDRKALRAALEEAEGMTSARLVVEEDRSQVLELMALDASGRMGYSPCLHIQEMVDAYATREEERVDRAAASLGAFVGSLAALEGRKLVLHVSDGIPLHPGAEVNEQALRLCSGKAVTQGESGGQDVTGHPDIYDPSHRTLGASEHDSSRLWQSVVTRATAGDVTIETVQAGQGNESRAREARTEVGRGDLLTPTAPSSDLQDTLFLLAEQTGGRAVLAGGDVAGELADALAVARGAYLVTYTPPAREPGAERHVRLVASRPGIDLQYRRLYRLRSIEEQLAEELLGRLLLTAGEQRGPCSLDMVRQQATAEGPVRARVRLRIPLSSLALQREGGVRHGQLTLLVAAADEDGRTTPVRQRRVPVRVADDAPTPEQITWETELPLHAGAHRLGVALRDETSGSVAFLVRELAIAPPR